MKEREEWIDVSQLKERAWFGLSEEERGISWLVLLDVLSPSKSKHRLQIGQRKAAYADLAEFHATPSASPNYLSPSIASQTKMNREIEKDVKRITRRREEDQAYIRAMRVFSKKNPVIGYVQGMCEIFKVFYEVYVSHFEEQEVEALAYFSFAKIAGGALDHFSSGQQGVERAIEEIEKQMGRYCKDVSVRFKELGVEVKYFAYNWMSTFMFREFSGHKKVMDAHFSLGVGEFMKFNVSFALSVVIFFKKTVITKNFEDTLFVLQNTSEYPWTEKELDKLLAISYIIYSGGTFQEE